MLVMLWTFALVLASCSRLALASVTDLAKANYTSYLETFEPGDFHLIEFYAHWCPHCKHFAPTYEQVGAFFEAEQASAPVHVARVDCAVEVCYLRCDEQYEQLWQKIQNHAWAARPGQAAHAHGRALSRRCVFAGVKWTTSATGAVHLRQGIVASVAC